MKTLTTLFLNLLLLGSTSAQRSTQHEFSSNESLYSNHLVIEGDILFFSFNTLNEGVNKAYLSKWDIKKEELFWTKEIAMANNNITIRPAKILALPDGSIILGAIDFSSANGFMNGNYTFLHFNEEGELLNSLRLGSNTGGQLHNLILDRDGTILFLGDRVNNQGQYRTVIGRLDADLKLISIRSVDLEKDIYTYGFGLAVDSEGHVYTAGYSQPAIGTAAAMISKWDADLNHLSSIIQLEDDPNTRFNHLYIDNNDIIHVGGNIGFLSTYLQFNTDLDLIYGHELGFGSINNIWKGSDEKIHMYIGSANYFVSFDQDYQINFEARQYYKGEVSHSLFSTAENKIYNISRNYSEADEKYNLVLNNYSYFLDHDCFLTNFPGDFNGPVRRDSFGQTNVIIRNETFTAVLPDDLTITDYDLQAEEICVIEIVSVKDQPLAHSLKVYPNPAKDLIRFQLEDTDETFRLSILNTSGQLLKDLIPIHLNESIDVSDLPSGMYLARIMDKNGNAFSVKFNKVEQ